MRCDPIRWKQSLFAASDRANLFLHQHGEGGHLSHSHFRTVQLAGVQYILGAEVIDLHFPLSLSHALFHSHLV